MDFIDRMLGKLPPGSHDDLETYCRSIESIQADAALSTLKDMTISYGCLLKAMRQLLDTKNLSEIIALAEELRRSADATHKANE